MNQKYENLYVKLDNQKNIWMQINLPKDELLIIGDKISTQTQQIKNNTDNGRSK